MANRIVALIQGRSRRELLIVAALAVFLIIVASVVFLMGGAEEAVDGDVGPRLSPRATPTPTARRDPPPISGGGFDGRDPFQPLVLQEAPDGGSGDGGGNGGEPAPEPTAGGPSQRRVTLVDIFREDGERMATVQVGDEQFTVAEGDTFDDNFQVVDITSRCATFLFGDERFTLCIGQEVRK